MMTVTVTQASGFGLLDVATILAAIGALIAAGAAWRQVFWSRKATEAAMQYQAPWKVMRRSTGQAILINDGPEELSSVRVSRNGTELSSIETFDSFSSRKIMEIAPAGTQILVSWIRPSDGTVHQWSTEVWPV